MAERLVVEIDGPEHRDPVRFEADRRRDLRLTLDGYTVVRFTNDYLTDDLGRVVAQIEQLVSSRRNDLAEGR
jgi:very-short-patch-repair endonuclease